MDIGERNCAKLNKEKILIEKNAGNITVVLGIETQTPWWGISYKSEYTQVLRDEIEKVIVKNINVDKTKIEKNNPNYLVWSWTSFENGEARFKKLIEVLSEYKIEQ